MTINAPNKWYTYCSIRRPNICRDRQSVRASGKLKKNNHSKIIIFINARGTYTTLPQQSKYIGMIHQKKKLKLHKFVFTYWLLIFL